MPCPLVFPSSARLDAIRSFPAPELVPALTHEEFSAGSIHALKFAPPWKKYSQKNAPSQTSLYSFCQMEQVSSKNLSRCFPQNTRDTSLLMTGAACLKVHNIRLSRQGRQRDGRQLSESSQDCRKPEKGAPAFCIGKKGMERQDT